MNEGLGELTCRRHFFTFLCALARKTYVLYKIPKSEKGLEIIKKVVYNGDKW